MTTGPDPKRIRQYKNIVNNELQTGLADLAPGDGYFEFSEPVLNVRNSTGRVLDAQQANTVYNNKRVAFDLNGRKRALIVSNFIATAVAENEAEYGAVDYVGTSFSNQKITGYYLARVYTLHDAICVNPNGLVSSGIPELKEIEEKEKKTSREKAKTMYARVYSTDNSNLLTKNTEVFVIPIPGSVRTGYVLDEVIGKAALVSPQKPVATSTAPEPAGLPKARPPSTSAKLPEVTSGDSPCADNGNYGAVKGQSISDVHHVMDDFFAGHSALPYRDGPEEGQEYTKNGITSPMCRRTKSSTSGKGSTDHQGTDIRGFTGTPVYATAPGVIMSADPNSGTLIIWHYRTEEERELGFRKAKGKRLQTAYLHLDTILINAGEVDQGTQVGTVGNRGHSDGSHLHYRISLSEKVAVAEREPGQINLPAFRANSDYNYPEDEVNEWLAGFPEPE